MRRVLAGLGIAIVAVAIVVVAITVISGRDSGEVNGATGPGVFERAPGTPPTSGSQRGASIARDGVPLSDDQIVSALALGNVVLVYDGDAKSLRTLQNDAAGPYSPDLEAAGQAVILDRRPGTSGVQALAWQRRLTVAKPVDPALAAFIDAWLGQAHA